MAKKVRYSQPLAVIWDAYQETVRKSTIEVSSKRHTKAKITRVKGIQTA